jgi:uncharacterized protein
MSAGIKIIRRSSFTATPWKNGGGITHEAIRVPPTGDAFQWRVSVAQIDSSGPFSDFSGYDRKMVLLQGHGLVLEFGSGERRVMLRDAGDCVEFDGATPARCELIDGPCVDLNLMVCKSLRTKTRIERLCEVQPVTAIHGETTLIMGIQDPLSLVGGGQSERLEPSDLAILNDCRAHVSKIAQLEHSAPSAVFIATISP